MTSKWTVQKFIPPGCMCTHIHFFTLKIKKNDAIFVQVLNLYVCSFHSISMWSLESNWVFLSGLDRKHNSSGAGRVHFSSKHISSLGRGYFSHSDTWSYMIKIETCECSQSCWPQLYFNIEVLLLVRKLNVRGGWDVASEVTICKENNWVKSDCVEMGSSENVSEC